MLLKNNLTFISRYIYSVKPSYVQIDSITIE